MKRVYDAHTANVAAIAAKNAEITRSRRLRKPPSSRHLPLPATVPSASSIRFWETAGGRP